MGGGFNGRDCLDSSSIRISEMGRSVGFLLGRLLGPRTPVFSPSDADAALCDIVDPNSRSARQRIGKNPWTIMNFFFELNFLIFASFIPFFPPKIPSKFTDECGNCRTLPHRFPTAPPPTAAPFAAAGLRRQCHRHAATRPGPLARSLRCLLCALDSQFSGLQCCHV